MNKYWPKKWNEKLPNFLGEDFFSSFDFLENNQEEGENSNDNTAKSPNFSSLKVDICELENELLLVFRAPGIMLEDVEIDVYDKTLEISGYIQVDHKKFRPIHSELYQGPVMRKVKLPYPCRHDKIKASYHHGYLYVHLHRLIRTKKTLKKIDVHDLDDAKD
ncbi:Molecular chaperone IbpA, HSP20 family [Oceanobacillus limi]|uniref:Molecular chaperone IbpA, HSP20 family n=1 Tax=Oceanobacillus limi TaxID=930131 RepID=A0A1I0FCP2_9BACI|nr:Hsp20/alpha crystallin family protein [Oceanobacillus limi]SET55117.1 Molecular chaperone IbpA, HSP20 family [Oceanobacillus limi]